MVTATTGDHGGGEATGEPRRLRSPLYGTHVVSSDDGAGREPVDPVFANLFRPEEPAAAPDEPEAAAEVGPPAVGVTSVVDDAGAEPVDVDADALAPVGEVVDEPHESDEPGSAPATPAAADPSVDTGRLFRSQGVTGNAVAVLALASDHGGRLRTLQRTNAEPAPPAPELDDAGPVEVAALMGGGRPEAAPRGRRRRPADAQGAAGSLRAGAVYLLVIGVTLVAAFANALLSNGDVGWPTGLALLVVTVFCALKVRRDDDSVAIIVPPIAFFLAALTAGQLFLGSAEGSLLNRAVVAFFTLADNWYWIIGATLAAVVIVVVRRRRA